ncbi:hypothetical protein [Serratia quinivorans]|jgi:hypothetical protein|uniref:hypothetical protein n=1 Tax=Serratia quinivorans TaxID=137545 RepID=UPI002177126B|nr:hypothetical protein [Serratia quinivorans]CAI0901511.1 Uncharacterised protein [Serratia quinivorans]CAI1777287.1 Uncharacterised protein [Serratia quinivorans]
MINQGLDTLRQAKVIDEDIYQGMLAVIEQLQRHYCLRPLPTEQGWLAIAHMANALMRCRQQRPVSPLDNEILAEIAEAGKLEEIRELNTALMKNFTVELHPDEEGYLLANWYSLSQL